MNSSRQNKNARVFVVSGTTGAIDKALTPKRFQIAVVDLDAVMTGDSQPKAVDQNCKMNGRSNSESGHP